ncbi:YbjN domain-containing protein [Sphingobium sp.]|uniref:YbjN domain-containing protein n=1 Tax=Sphingobium sp. TaxID=1912891 RepID=UPI002C4670EC|nr:YbjN domain-containing protein [Sphingobium sp.]HUD91041.1 YbjN domain-containing protein [Sphingobium sp.]
MTPFRLSLVALGFALSVPAEAATESKADCAADMVCAANPQSIVAALQKAGYTAELTKDSLGDPMINSAAAGYTFSVLFYDCTDHLKCESLQLQASFDPNEKVTTDYVNKWNTGKRFVRAAVNDKHEMDLRYDVATIGGLNSVNFRDVLDWWTSLLGDYSNFAGQNLD